jgi:hypothetical protein
MRKSLPTLTTLAIFIFEASYGLCASPPAGSAEVTIRGSVTVCVAQGTMTPKLCSAAGAAAVETSVIVVGRISWDAQGNACSTATEIISVPGTVVSMTEAVIFVGKIATYNATTQMGTATVVGYSGGSCSGPVPNLKDAVQRSTSDVQFVLSQGGNRLDGIVTKISFPSVELGAVSLSGTGIKQ